VIVIQAIRLDVYGRFQYRGETPEGGILLFNNTKELAGELARLGRHRASHHDTSSQGNNCAKTNQQVPYSEVRGQKPVDFRSPLPGTRAG
jgi:hypothetical protein